MGLVTQALAESAMLHEPLRFELIEIANGWELDFAEVFRPSGQVGGMVDEFLTKTKAVAVDAMVDGPGVSRNAPEKIPKMGPDPEKVKALLTEVMERVPSLNTIRAWTPKQRQDAVKWVKKCLSDPNPNGQIRPAFIVPPEPRKSRIARRAAKETTPVPKSEGGATLEVNEVFSSEVNDFFSSDDEDE